MTDAVQLPSKAVTGASDLSAPTVRLLRDLNLLPSDDDLEKADGVGALFKGPPSSVALIEANATALSKWWAAGLGASVLGTWTGIATWWTDQEPPTQRVALWAAAIATAGAILAIGYIIGSDVRGRAAAMVSTVEARARVATSVIEAAQALYEKDPPTAGHVLALPTPLSVRYIRVPGADEAGWRALCVQTDGSATKYLVVKGTQHEWANAADVTIEP